MNSYHVTIKREWGQRSTIQSFATLDEALKVAREFRKEAEDEGHEFQNYEVVRSSRNGDMVYDIDVD
jgi:hypothetical protein